MVILSFIVAGMLFLKQGYVFRPQIIQVALGGMLLVGMVFPAFAQTTVKGTIVDKQTRQPIPSVTVSFPEIKLNAVSDNDGRFRIHTGKPVKIIRFSAIGYKAFTYTLPRSGDHQLQIDLDESSNNLDDVTIVAQKRPRYSNKNNEAVEMIRQVIANRDKNRREQNNTVVFKQYEKLSLSLSMAANQVEHSAIVRKFPFLAKTADRVKQPGRALIPLFMREKLSQCMETKDHLNDKSTVLDQKQSRIDQFFDEDGIDEYLNQIYQPVDLYDHDLGIGSQRFLSPIAQMAPEFYKYFIMDTVKNVQPNMVHLMFSPRNKQDQLFMGEMYIPLDGKYAVTEVTLTLNKAVNLNFVKDFETKISYKKDEQGKYYISNSIMAMDLGLFKGKYTIFGERSLNTADYKFVDTNYIFPTAPILATKKDVLDTFQRPFALTSLEQNAYNNIDSLKQSPKFRRMAALSALVLTGYHTMGPVDLGPVSSFYSFNNVEGTRFRIGGRTNAVFSDKIVLDGHVAYGLKDEKWKHALSMSYSFKPKDPLQFPIHSFTVKHSFETQIPGQDLNFLEDDNFLLSFKRGVNDKWLYNQKWSGEYFRELENHLSFKAGYRNQQFNPAGGLVFQPLTGNPVQKLHLSEFTAELRWAPGEQFYQGKRYRRPIKNAYPIFTLRGSAGVKDFLSGDYNYQNISLHVFKRLFISPFGYSDIVLEGGMVFGKVPFPLLAIHRANQTYAYQIQAYNLMNFMEFMSDRYASINIDHSLNGAILNKVPLIKKLHLREMASLKVLYGGISSKNMPDNDPRLYRFATNKDGVQTSFGLDRAPYIEASVGISNIFKLLRVDYIRRFNYLDHPNVTKSGIRARIHVDF